MTKFPYQLEVGECFSYPGSFKIYKVLTEPMVDPVFENKIQCPNCTQEYHPFTRLKFKVTDGSSLRNRMGIRLRSDVACTIHPSLDAPLDPDQT